jgi:hypothetical protein
MRVRDFCLVGCIWTMGCTDIGLLQTEYRQTVDYARRNIPPVQEFLTLYPSGIVFITHFTAPKGESVLRCKTALHDRYVVSMEVFDAAINRKAKTVERYGRISIVIIETILIEGRSHKFGFSKFLTAEEWSTLLRHGGDFESIGIHLQGDAPVPGFREWWAKEVSLH